MKKFVITDDGRIVFACMRCVASPMIPCRSSHPAREGKGRKVVLVVRGVAIFLDERRMQ
jgi:hypothetical protein